MADGLSGKAKAGFLWSSVGFVGTKAVSFVATIVLARLVAPEDFGVLAAILAFIAVIELAGNVGLGAAVVYEQEEGITSRVQTAFTLNVVLSLLLAALGLLAAEPIARFLGAGDEALLFQLASASLLLTALGNVHDALLKRELRFKARIVADLVRTGVRTAVSIGLAVGGMEATALVVGLLAGNAAWAVVQWTLTRFRPTLELDPRAVRAMLVYGGGATALEVLAVINNRVDTVVISRVLGQGPLGLYSVAFRVPEMLISSVAWNLSIVAFPVLARQRATDRDGLARMTLALLRYQTLYALPMAAGLAALAPSLIVVLFGERWAPAGGVLQAVAVMSAASALAFPLGDVFKALGRQRVLAAYNVAWVPLTVGGVILVAPAGIVAVAWVRAGAEVLFAALVVLTAARQVGIGAAETARAELPGTLAALGVLAATVPAQLALSGTPLAAVVAGGLGGVAAAALVVRVTAPAEWATLTGLLLAPLRQRSGRALPSSS